MLIFAISGDGSGAGKSTLAKLLAGPSNVWSLAGQIRQDLKIQYPDYNWDNRDQKYKDTTKVKQLKNKTVRQVMIEYGQLKCQDNPNYWVEKLIDRLELSRQMALTRAVAIDDLRKLSELEYLRRKFGKDIVHFHVRNPDAKQEPHFENDALAAIAEHLYTWRKS